MKSFAVLVGTDGSPGSAQAVQFAAREADARGGTLRIVHVYDWRVRGARAQVAGGYADRARAQAESVVLTAVDAVRDKYPLLSLSAEALVGDPAAVLVAASRDAELLVVGGRGRGGFANLLLGSVSQQVSTHAIGPVAVVHGDVSIDGPVVVGVDGSESADHALGLALAEAERHGLRVVAVRAYSPGTPALSAEAFSTLGIPEARRESELELLRQCAQPWLEKYPSVAVEFVASPAHPTDALAKLSVGAAMVVVGSRGRGGFASVLLGSVGLQLLHYAHCPVLIDRVRVAQP